MPVIMQYFGALKVCIFCTHAEPLLDRQTVADRGTEIFQVTIYSTLQVQGTHCMNECSCANGSQKISH